MNKVILMGRLTRDPEVRYTQSGKAVATFSLAVDRRNRRAAEASNQPTADFIPIVAWDKQAELCGNYLQKGRQVLVEGRIQIRQYEAQDGGKRFVTEVVTESIEFVGSRNDANAMSAPSAMNTMATTSAMSNTHVESASSFQPVKPDTVDNNSFGNPIPSDEEIPF